MSETSGSTAPAKAERVRKAMATHILIVGYDQAINLLMSIGLAACPEDARSEEGLIAIADQDIHAAKRAGCNRLYWFGKSQLRNLSH